MSELLTIQSGNTFYYYPSTAENTIKAMKAKLFGFENFPVTFLQNGKIINDFSQINKDQMISSHFNIIGGALNEMEKDFALKFIMDVKICRKCKCTNAVKAKYCKKTACGHTNDLRNRRARKEKKKK